MLNMTSRVLLVIEEDVEILVFIITQFLGGFNSIRRTSKLGERYKKDETILIMTSWG